MQHKIKTILHILILGLLLLLGAACTVSNDMQSTSALYVKGEKENFSYGTNIHGTSIQIDIPYEAPDLIVFRSACDPESGVVTFRIKAPAQRKLQFPSRPQLIYAEKYYDSLGPFEVLIDNYEDYEFKFELGYCPDLRNPKVTAMEGKIKPFNLIVDGEVHAIPRLRTSWRANSNGFSYMQTEPTESQIPETFDIKTHKKVIYKSLKLRASCHKETLDIHFELPIEIETKFLGNAELRLANNETIKSSGINSYNSYQTTNYGIPFLVRDCELTNHAIIKLPNIAFAGAKRSIPEFEFGYSKRRSFQLHIIGP